MSPIVKDQLNAPISVSDKSSFVLDHFIKFIFIQALNYIKFSQITFTVLMYSAIIIIFLAGVQDVFFKNAIYSKSVGKGFSLGPKEIINLYFLISFIFYLISQMIKKVTKISFSIRLRRRVTLAVIAPIISYTILSLLALNFTIAPGSSRTGTYWVFLILCLITIASGIYSVIISIFFNFIIKAIEGDKAAVEKLAAPLYWFMSHDKQSRY